MIMQTPIVETPVPGQIADLSVKLQQLRRLRTQRDKPASSHLNSAFQAHARGSVNQTKLDPGVFIGIIINSVPNA
jgi:hypothetical protein